LKVFPGKIKITDFGAATYCPTGLKLQGAAGTLAWMAPEILRGETYDSSVDIFSFGVIILEMFFCMEPPM